MFQIKARVDYGLLIMFELAKNPLSITPVSNIAKRMGVSSAYLIQIARLLSAANLIKSKEGAGGGYYLTRAPSRISVLEIIEALEGKIKLNCALDRNYKCPQAKNCQVRSVWDKILPDLKIVLKKRSLASLLK